MITVAIIPQSLEHLKSELSRLSFAKSIQIDVVDGIFVPNKSWPYEPTGSPSELSSLLVGKRIEIDLMVSNQAEAAKSWHEAGASAAVFHLEGLNNPEAVFSSFTAKDFELGLAVGNDTELERLYPHIDSVSFVQLMGIAEIGSQGQPFDSRILERVFTLRNLYPNLTISIDGAVSEQTIGELKKAGANKFVVGSAIVKANDPEAKYAELLKAVS